MRARLVGATLAALGGVMLAMAAVVPRWWHGPIHIAGKIIHGKTVHISLLRVSGCNAGDGSCMGLDVGALFRTVTLTTLGIAAATVVMAGLLVRALLRAPAAAARAARGVLIGAAASVVGGVVTIVTLPARFEEISVGGGSFAFFFGAVALLAASIVTLAARAQRHVDKPEPIDVREILSTDGLAPSALGPEPKLGRFGAVAQGPSAPTQPRFRPWYEAQPVSPLEPARSPSMPGMTSASSAGFAAAVAPTEPGFGPAGSSGFGMAGPPTEPGFGPAGSSGFGMAGPPTEPGFGPPAAGSVATHVGVPLAPSGRSAPMPAQAPVGARAEVQGPTHVGVPVAPSYGMSFDVSDVTNPANRLMAARAPAPATRGPAAVRPALAEPPSEPLSVSALEPVSEPATYEPLSSSALEPVSKPASDPGFDSATSPAQPSMAAMLDHAPHGAQPADEGDDELRTLQVERFSSSELLEEDAPDPEPTTSPSPSAAPAGKGVLVREPVGGDAPKRPSVPRVPTATTSASLAALAALSKPAHITIPSNLARKLPPPKPSEITQANPAPACPTCVAPMGWVEKHLRYYCSACRVYG